ncbi:MAG: glycosyltransferase family 87 protein [Candidatus Limnocylindrales bacterium]|jgi:hypothetical protein
MERRRLLDRLPQSSVDGPGGWLLVALLGIYLLATTQGRSVPLGSGVDYWPAWGASVAAALLGASLFARRFRPTGPWLRPVEAAAVLAVAAMVLTDLTMTYQPLRDLGIYLKAGQHYLAGTPVYLQAAMTARPADLTDYPFLYPPLTLPLFAVMAQLPTSIAQAIWVSGSLALGLVALRIFGLPWRWLVFAAAWPPLFQGLWVGNVAVPALALFALGPWLGEGLVVGAIFKSYTGLAALWLVRERRWRQLAIGAALVVALALLALPITGVGPWQAWIEGLRLYQTSQQNVPVLYGFGLPEFVPLWAFVALAAAALLAALCVSGRESLARFGTATIVASPSLWGHGLLVAVPSMLSLRALWLWLAIGITSAPDGLQWWWAIALIAASWFAPGMRRATAAEGSRVEGGAYLGGGDTEPHEPLHPLAAGSGPWGRQDGRNAEAGSGRV